MQPLRTLLYRKTATAKHLQITAISMQCDLEPERNRTHMAEWVEAVLSQHPDVD
jgi:hypothetical protein